MGFCPALSAYAVFLNSRIQLENIAHRQFDKMCSFHPTSKDTSCETKPIKLFEIVDLYLLLRYTLKIHFNAYCMLPCTYLDSLKCGLVHRLFE
jgi:hypothetical protein